jgi:hypothetical protein
MKKLLLSMLFGAFVAYSFEASSQRYVTEIFDTYIKTENVQFGVNVNPLISTFPDPANPDDLEAWNAEMAFLNNLIDESVTNPDTLLSYSNFFFPNSVLPAELQTMVKIAPLEMDVYTPPAEDELAQRPVFVYIHTGNFLPPLYNGGITGDKIDSAAVNICKQMAKRGYVAVSINYRLGWNPTSTNENTRRGTLLQAVFRAVHDTQSAVRFLRTPVGAQFGVDPAKIALIGQGSGGYVAQAYSTLDDYVNEIAELPKFRNTETQLPFVIESIDGTIEGGPGLLRLHDPLFDLGLSKDISMSVNMGGALADESWLEQGDAPMVSFHTIRDPFAPFDEGMVVVPTTNENVVPVHGANFFIQKANDLGNNDAFADLESDPYTDAARSHYGQTYDYIFAVQPTITVSPTPEGLFPFLLPLNGDGPLGVYGNQGAPWDFWDFETLQVVVTETNNTQGTDFNATQLHTQGILSNPGMGPEKALTYIDTIQNYLHPRAVLAMDLATGIGELPEVKNAMKLYPNPSTMGSVTIENEKAIMREVIIMDALGKVVYSNEINAFRLDLNHSEWNNGLYFVTVVFQEGGQLTQKLVIR